MIAWAERLGWAYDVRWPDRDAAVRPADRGAGQTLGSMTDRAGAEDRVTGRLRDGGMMGW